MKNKRVKLIVPQEFWNRFILIPVFLVITVFNLVLLANVQIFSLTLWEMIRPEALIIIGAFEVVLVTWLVILGIILSHQIAGPIVALKSALKHVGQGNLTVTLHFRKRDFNQDIPEYFNENVEKLRQQVAMVKQLATQLSEEVPADHESYKTLEKLNDKLNYFSTTSELRSNKDF